LALIKQHYLTPIFDEGAVTCYAFSPHRIKRAEDEEETKAATIET
jgi:hypothetical protein